MTLLVCLLAAAASTVLWYRAAPADDMKLHILCYMYWGASLMWMVDAAFEYMEMGAEFFSPSPADMLNDLYLGMYAVALGLAIWLTFLLASDPKGVVKKALADKSS